MPRRPSTDLFDLVHSLTPAERGYVHKTLSRPLGRVPNGMLALFTAMVSALRPDDPALRAVIADAGGGASQLKRLLFDHVLRTLRSLDSVRDPRVSVHAFIQDGTLLLERTLTSAARDRFEQAEQAAGELHAFMLQAEALQWLIKIERSAGQPNDPERLSQLRMAREEAMRIATDLSTMAQLSAELFASARTSDVAAMARTALKHPLVAASSHPHVRLRFWQSHIRAMASYMLDDEPSQDAALAVMMSIMQDHPVFLAEDNAITLLSNILTTRLHRRDSTGSREVLTLLERIDPPSARLKDELWYNVARGYMYVLLLEGRDADVIAMEQEIKDRIDEHPLHGDVVWRSWRLLAATAHLRRGDYKAARLLAASILNERDLPEHQYTVPRIQELLCLIAEGEVELALYRARSMENALRSARAGSSVAGQFVRHIKGLARGGRSARTSAEALLALIATRPAMQADRTMFLTLQAETLVPAVLRANPS